ncbi:uncharacterized protein LOC117328485 [Pecten maximus]|uniref:uncharacterized protein LOC117328485 n=1 Tax=Pecten maximus TaxID=6579 RepID=UPI0014587DC4|nr:uncharacterized protein LOC117328485 [Pecten maximus]
MNVNVSRFYNVLTFLEQSDIMNVNVSRFYNVLTFLEQSDIMNVNVSRFYNVLTFLELSDIMNVNIKYRKRQLKHVIRAMDKDKTKCGTQLLKDITLLQAIYWIDSAWKEVDVTTITKCFIKCGFSESQQRIHDDDDNDDDNDDDVPLSVLALSRDLFDCDFKDLVAIDQSMATCDLALTDWNKDAKDILQDITVDDPALSDDDGDDEQGDDEDKPCSICEGEFYIKRLRALAISQGKSKMLNHVMGVDECLLEMRMDNVEGLVQQSKISDFFLQK